MKKHLSIILILIMSTSLLLAACGGGDGGDGPPVDMGKFEGSSFKVEYPEGWQENSMDMFGITMAIFSPQEISAEQLQSMDFADMALEEPMALVMAIPAEMTGQMGFEDIDTAMDEFNDIGPGDDVDIIKNEDTKMGGAEGKLMIAKGEDATIGKIGMHLVAAKQEGGNVVVLMGITPDKDLDQNLDIFQYMQDSFTFE